MPHNEWDDVQIEDFTLEDVLLEFGNTKRPDDVSNELKSLEELREAKREEESIIDQDIFDEIKNENTKKQSPTKKAQKVRGRFSTLDFLKREKKVVPPQIKEEKQHSPHAVSATRAPVKKEKRARLDETLNLNDLFENKEDYNEENLKVKDILPSEYVKRNAGLIRLTAIRSFFAFILSVLACYLSFSSQFDLPMLEIVSYSANPFWHIAALICMHLIAIAMHGRIFFRGLKALFTLRPDMLALVATSSIATLIHAVFMLLNESARLTIPYCSVCIVMLFFAGVGTYLRASARVRACKAASASKEPFGVYISERDGDINLIKHPISEIEPFTKYVQMPDGAERFWTYLSPIIIVASLLLSIISSIGRSDPARFFWAFAAITTVSTPFFILICYGLPFSKITKKLANLGAALAGWYAAFSFSGSRNLVMRDSDIFPKGTVSSHGLKVFNNFSLEKVVCYATSMVYEAKSGLAPVFEEILKSQYGRNEKVSHLMHHESGGMEAEIRGDYVLFGTASFITSMGIGLTEVTSSKNTMYLAINKTLAAAFNLKYRLSEEVKDSIESVVKARLNPVMASIDCNQTPIMIESEINVKSGAIEYPRIEDRLDLASEEQYLEYDPAAFITRAGIMPFASAVIAARRLRKITIRNVVLSTICAIVGMLLMFYITFVGSYESGNAYNVLVYMLLWTLPVYILSSRIGIN